MDLDSDAADWARARAGDGEAFGRIHDRRSAAVRRQVRRLVARLADVEDAVAVVFLEAWRRRADVVLVDGSLLPWLIVTATNVARNTRRSRIRYERLLAHLPQPDPSPDPADAVGDREALTAMRRLSLIDQQVLALCVLEGMPERDAAAALAVAPGTVKSRLHRAKQRLRARLERGEPRGKGIHDGV